VTDVAVNPPGTSNDTATSFDYDLSGRTTKQDPDDALADSYTWDAEGHLATTTTRTGAGGGAQTTSYTYTAEGDRLIRRDAAVTTVYLPGGTELRLTGTTETAQRFYSHAGRTVATRTGTGPGGVTTLVPDHQGTALVSLAPDRTAARRYQTPFGQARGSVPGWTGDHSFLDAPTDQDSTGWVHLGAREYETNLGRFLTVDQMVDPYDPQTLNGYAYALNAPVTFADPSGLIVDPGTGSGGGGGHSGSTSTGGSCYATSTCASSAVTPGRVEGSGPPACDTTCAYNQKVAIIVARLVPPPPPPDPPWYKRAWDVTAEVSGVNDVISCVGGSASSCAWVAVSLIPGGRVLAAGRSTFRLANRATNTADAAASTRSTVVSASCRANSFTGDTDVLMADGTHTDIDDLHIGDWVWATDPETGERGPRQVTEIITGTGAKTLIHLTIETGDRDDDTEQTIVATDGHPFWTPAANAWTPADELGVGTELATAAGDTATITTTRTEHTYTTVYNLTVNDIHTYYVGAIGDEILVHNCGTDVAGGFDDADSLFDGARLRTNDALDASERFLGHGYQGVSNGRFLSGDGMRQVRMTDADLAHPTQNPHMNFETFSAPTGPGVRGAPSSNLHIYLPEEVGW